MRDQIRPPLLARLPMWFWVSAESLHVSLSTVKTHVSNLLLKLAARTRVHLVIVAYEAGLV